MNNSASPKNMKKTRIDGEVLAAIILLFFTVFLILSVSVFVFRSCTGEEQSHVNGEITTPQQNQIIPPQNQINAIFSGGTVPNKPYSTDATQTISLSTTSQYIVLTNAQTGEIIASRSSGVKFSPASMTKVMSLIVMCERLTEEDLDKTLIFTSDMYNTVRSGGYVGSTNYGIDPNDEYKIEDLLYGIGMHSASDCVLPIVLYLAGTEEKFVEWMNEKAEALGLSNTHFDNPIGYESEQNYTTAEDMSVIMAYAMQNELIRSTLSKEIHTSTAAGYSSTGEFVPSFSFTIYSSLFGTHEKSRMHSYQKYYNEPFTLKTTKLLAGKTGYLENGGVKNHCLVIYARSTTTDDYYVLVVGGGTDMQYVTMKDIKNILDTYAN